MRDLAAARRFVERATGQHGLRNKITIGKSGTNTAVIHAIQEDTGPPIELHQVKYLNDIVEQDHQAIKRLIWPMLSFQTFVVRAFCWPVWRRST